jgi:hypothetical protein
MSLLKGFKNALYPLVFVSVYFGLLTLIAYLFAPDSVSLAVKLWVLVSLMTTVNFYQKS